MKCHIIWVCSVCLDTKVSSEEEIQYYLESIAYGHLKCKMNHPMLTVSKNMEDSISIQRVNSKSADEDRQQTTNIDIFLFLFVCLI